MAGDFAAVAKGLEPFVERGDLSGVVTLTWQDGEVLQSDALGFQDIDAKTPMQRDTLFRIASMSKPITSVMALMLMEEGKLRLDDPIIRWAPEFADMKVVRDPKGALDDVEPAHRDITIEDLLTHRAGLAYAFSSTGPLAEAHEKALGPPLASPHTADRWLAAIASLPLTYQPGERMHYSHATEVLGFVLGRVAGKPIAELLEERIFAPLGMTDTAFHVPPEKQDRLATLYRFDTTADRLTPVPMPMPSSPPDYAPGGGGLVSTADDYLTFARLLLNDGEVDGVRLLKPETVQMMRTDRLTAEQRGQPFLGLPMWMASGFGLGLAVVDAPEKNIMGVGGAGSFTWPGAFGTWWQADPTKNLILIFMVQHYLELGPDAGAMLAAGRGMAGRMALPAYQKLTYDAVG